VLIVGSGIKSGSEFQAIGPATLPTKAQFTPPARHDKTVLSVSCEVRGDKFVISLSHINRRYKQRFCTSKPDQLRHRKVPNSVGDKGDFGHFWPSGQHADSRVCLPASDFLSWCWF